MARVREEVLAEGSYARKQLFSRSALVSWSHRSRFRLGRELARKYGQGTLLDYGCGDGTFLAMVHDLFPRAVGADIDPHHVEEARGRFRALEGLRFVATGELGEEARGRYGMVTCMEVLEHLTTPSRAAVIAELRRLVAPEGFVLVSVPVETGPTLLGKEAARSFAGWRGIGDYKYKERYTAGELWTMVFAGARTRISRPEYTAEYGAGERSAFHGHKGFNWRQLRGELLEHFTIEETRFSPLGWLAGLFSSQVWFVCRAR